MLCLISEITSMERLVNMLRAVAVHSDAPEEAVRVLKDLGRSDVRVEEFISADLGAPCVLVEP